jgi:hypothetical protein
MKTLILPFLLLLACFISCTQNDDIEILEKNVNSYDVYVTGVESNQACYWKNTVKNVLPAGNNYKVLKLFVDNNNIYVMGSYQNPVTYEVNYYYWKNNTKYDIAQSLGIVANTSVNNNFKISDFLVKDGNLYIAGLIKNPSPTSNQDMYQYCYWKNGLKTVVFEQYEYQTSASLYVLGNDVYVPLEKNITSAPSINWDLGYYKNGTYHFVNTLSNCLRIFNNNGNVLMHIKDQSNNTSYFKNLSTGTITSLPSFMSQDVIKKIIRDGNDQYYVGNQFYYKNGVSYPLFTPGSEFKILDDFDVLDSNVYKIIHKDHLGIDYKVYINDVEVQSTANTINGIEKSFTGLTVIQN